MTSIPPLSPAMSFDEACLAVVHYLEEALPLGYWAVTRYDGTNQLYLSVADKAYGRRAGDSHLWSDSLCQYSTSGRAPEIAPDAMSVPEYASAGVAQEMRIGAFVGIPIQRADGQLFGTICGLDPEVQPEALADRAGLLRLLATLLGTVLEADLARAEAARALERAELQAESDLLTGLYNRRGWERWIEFEEDRFRRYGDPGHVIVIDLDGLKEVNDRLGHGAGDEYIRKAGAVLRQAIRSSDVAARLGGDEFGIIAARSTPEEAHELVERVRAALTEAGVAASFGAAPYTFVAGFPGAWEAADKAMYEDKRLRRAARPA